MKTYFNHWTVFAFLFTIQSLSFSQNVGINTTGASPNSSALLDVDASPANDKGILVPRVSLVATNLTTPVTLPANSLLVYNTATNGVFPFNVIPGYYYWNGSSWISLSGGGNSNDWSILGNSNTTPASNFIGTTNNQDLVFRTNNIENMRIKSATGRVGIGTNNPFVAAHILSGVVNPPLVLQNTVTSGYSGLWCYSDLSVLQGHMGYGNTGSTLPGLFYSGSIASIPYILTSNDVERIRINPVGEIGIGTSTPNAKVEIYSNSSTGYGNLRLTENQNDYARLGWYNTSSTKFWETAAYANNVDSLAYYNVFNSSTGNVFSIRGDRNIGISNQDPQFPLSFAPALGEKISLWGNVATSHYGMGIQSNLMQFYSNASSSDIAFGYGGSNSFTENVRIMGNGNVGIGTVTPQSALEVNGYTMLGSNAPAIKTLKIISTTAASQGSSTSLVHGLTASKILAISIMVEYSPSAFVPDAYNINPGYEFSFFYNAANLFIYNTNTNSANILSKPLKVFITYEQ